MWYFSGREERTVGLMSSGENKGSVCVPVDVDVEVGAVAVEGALEAEDIVAGCFVSFLRTQCWLKSVT